MMVDLMHAMVATPFKKLKELNEAETQVLLTEAKKGSMCSPKSLPRYLQDITFPQSLVVAVTGEES
jgi:hypothetical protein